MIDWRVCHKRAAGKTFVFGKVERLRGLKVY